DADHLNTYGDLDTLREAFLDFSKLVEPGGFLITCADDEGGRWLAGRARDAGVTVYTYGEADDADPRMSEIVSAASGVRYLASFEGASLGEISMRVPGRHLGLNSAAAVLTTLKLGVPLESIVEALGTFQGVRRRFELKGTVDGVRVYDEYAYHPTSMTA